MVVISKKHDAGVAPNIMPNINTGFHYIVEHTQTRKGKKWN